MSVALALLVLGLVTAPRAHARPWLCLPPLFDGGQRLHALPAPRLFWLELLLRQHELCWRRPRPPGELRIALVGSSAVYGFPLPVEETFAGRLNQHFATAGVPARLFNLAFVNPYQIRDAVIIDAALSYAPDVILYPMTLAEFRHLAPIPFPQFAKFFDANRGRLRTMISAPPPGLEEPFAQYDRYLQWKAEKLSPTDQLREAGLFVRLGAQTLAASIAARLNAPPGRFEHQTKGRQPQYNCADTEWTVASDFADWKQWNILAYLGEIARTRGIPTLVVHWPIAHEPVDVCYSIRYTNAAVTDFVQWLHSETAARGLAYLDLHDLLPPELFIDSLHVSADGHRLLADAIARALEPMLRELSAARGSARMSNVE